MLYSSTCGEYIIVACSTINQNHTQATEAIQTNGVSIHLITNSHGGSIYYIPANEKSADVHYIKESWIE